MKKFTQFEVVSPLSPELSAPELTDGQVAEIAAAFSGLPLGILCGWWLPLPGEGDTIRVRAGAIREDGQVAEGEFVIDPVRLEVRRDE